ncbi:MAG: tRNA pseudouridine(55) synthase TruB, partial [Gemmatimonadetes bacterium]|nr:tRNA pseudouridine(55) synthase TruB [Gemmatimonadota bacterium]
MTSAGGLEGVLLADKPAGPTSHDVVARVRRAFGGARVGHAGTLDPFATGLLVLLLGRATRLAEYVSALDKTYVATLRLGASSTTGDPEGEIREIAGDVPDEAHVRAALAGFLGEQAQVPPIFSAKRVGGERARRLARRRAPVALAPSRVRIERIDLVAYASPRLTLRVTTGPGVYIRSLARDLGESLGSAGYVTALRREAIGGFRVEDALQASDLEDPAGGASAVEELAARLLPPAAAVAHLPTVTLGARDAM